MTEVADKMIPIQDVAGAVGWANLTMMPQSEPWTVSQENSPKETTVTR